MKSIAISTLLLTTLASAYVVPTPQQLGGTNKHGLRYKSHEFEYGSGDDRVRALPSDDRGSVLKLLEEMKRDGAASRDRVTRQQNQESDSSAKPQAVASASITTQPNAYSTWSDVDGDRSSLSYLLQPPAPPLKTIEGAIQAPSPPKPSRQTTSRSAPVVSLHSLQDYDRLLSNPAASGVLTLIRFSAPWCQVCRTTAVSFERMAAKLSKSGGIQFCSVVIDSNEPTDEKNVLKDALGVHAVPTGVLYHPSRGIIGRVNLNRVNLGELKKRLGGYASGALHRQGEMMWMEALVMGLEVGEKKSGGEKE